MTNKTHVQVKPWPSDFPRSSAINWIPPEQIMTELDALEQLKNEWIRNPHREPDHSGTRNREIIILDLDDYDIYGTPGSKREYDFVSFHLLSPEVANVSLDGLISHGNTRLRINCVPILSYSIEGYDDADDGAITIFVQTKQAYKDRTYDIWYRLTNKPSAAYERFYKTFVWIATFGKHFVDYLGSRPDSTVGLCDFRGRFYSWLKTRFNQGAYFHDWYKEFGKADFRSQVNAYIGYLYNQAYNLSNREMLLRHPIWADCMVGDRLSIKKQPLNCDMTITTPFVYQCFKDMYFGYCLEDMTPSEAVMGELEKQKRLLGFPKDMLLRPSESQARPYTPMVFKIGDVIGVPPDTNGLQKTADADWLAYVQKVEPLDNGVQRLYVLWLYRPSDTIIKNTPYPIDKEFFLSDNCNCGSADAPLLSTEVLRLYSVDWWPKDLNTRHDILVRQKYITQEKSFVALKRSSLTCRCDQTTAVKFYEPGETVYMKARHSKSGPRMLEPVVISEVKTGNMVIVRRLRRLNPDCMNALGSTRRRGISANELVWTDEFEEVSTKKLNRRCHIRFFPKEDILTGNVPLPYNRRGNGDFWFFCTKLTKVDEKRSRLEFLSDAPSSLTQGFDPKSTPPFKKLTGLSIFSGSGNFDRGLEEGGAVDIRTTVDFSPEAIHTQKANARHPETLNLYCGSVDDFLEAVLTGTHHKSIARIGEVQFIAGGSPCPGFSALQLDPFGERSCRNASHITTICSYTDIFRPQYAIFENVVNMSATRKGYESQNVLSHVVACFVAMGYQTQFAIVDAWNYSSAQSRERLCISIAAPSVEPISHPWHTHRHPETVRGRRLGKQLDGASFGDREKHDTAFHFATAGEATSDLPNIGTGSIQACISFPDHRLAAPMSLKDRLITKHVPTYPPGQGYAEALRLGLIPQAARKNMSEMGKSFRRAKKDGLFPTITTTISAQNSRQSGVLHWEQPRPISIQEARRAQGFLDHEVIIGTPSQQLKQIGNAVDRNVALALGLALRSAWEKSCARNQRLLITANRHAVPKTISKTKHDIPNGNGVSSVREVAEPIHSKVSGIFGKGRLVPLSAALQTSPATPAALSASTKNQRDENIDSKRTYASSKSLEPRKKIRLSGLELEEREETQHLELVVRPTFVSKEKAPGSMHDEDDINNNRLSVGQSKEMTPKESFQKFEWRRTEAGSVRSQSTDQTSTSDLVKRTRRSGHQIEFTPTAWDKTVESMIRKKAI
ncbi:S-adenosyl-L-methionine-dependent methyltransferase [Melanomma pulvis-pyrius CBS 109.77]|uniref:DNA (cytosine-5-)-methyltransferase n=1 Tax=Melanomma pulvis-pyrius CBS 109.77 TaxID=1314802 RepID=A0A6A6WTF9_9PLEO|nr:S-adenosyl-L-methionine-dependent methyltransferase [Melanomma pulvis-pyrius CBS 109.77]